VTLWLLDTNVFRALGPNGHRNVRGWLDTIDDGALRVSVMTLLEMRMMTIESGRGCLAPAGLVAASRPLRRRWAESGRSVPEGAGQPKVRSHSHPERCRARTPTRSSGARCPGRLGRLS